MSDWSQRKSWNNDGMDPDWRPSPPPEPTDEQIIRNAVDVLRRKLLGREE